ncbi:AraC family transcriptional regulator [Aureimonas leprariae]|uniref:AraC family transcriptional regulator n=1 Tax=Plantimonas leprariae TaxID=2615207 RepID=A0A7V7PLV5_9HYPH|nr:AraC family transcriptional regulator [Aureimonas leprariae]KAB0677552.1 AraC family transcriptional regulator [Aureimonas leprariae]
MSRDVLDRLLITLAVRLHISSVCRIQRGWRLAFGPFEAITVHYVLNGSGGVRIDGGAWVPFYAGSVIIVPARRPHAIGEPNTPVGEVRGEERCAVQHEGLVTFTGGDGSSDTLLVCGMIPATYDGALGLLAALQGPLIENLPADRSFDNAFALMRAEIERPTVGTQALTEALMKQCLVLLLRRHLMSDDTSPVTASLRDPRLTRAVLAVVERPANPHTVESLARVAGMSRAAFAERFSQTFRQTPIDFVGKVRLRLAAQLLTTTDLPVGIIATSIGYASRSYFSRAFRAAYGLEPKRYREVGGQEEREPESVRDTLLPETLSS